MIWSQLVLSQSTRSRQIALEGKDYEVSDGDVILFRFNV